MLTRSKSTGNSHQSSPWKEPIRTTVSILDIHKTISLLQAQEVPPTSDSMDIQAAPIGNTGFPLSTPPPKAPSVNLYNTMPHLFASPTPSNSIFLDDSFTEIPPGTLKPYLLPSTTPINENSAPPYNPIENLHANPDLVETLFRPRTEIATLRHDPIENTAEKELTCNGCNGPQTLLCKTCGFLFCPTHLWCTHQDPDQSIETTT